MIRINLLQVRAKRERKKASVATQVAVLLVFLLAEVAAIVFLEVRFARKIKARENDAQEIQAALAAKRSQMSDLDVKRTALEKINQKKKVIQDLQAARTGPKFMLLEVMTILSKGDGPMLDDATRRRLAQHPDQGFHRDWDYRRLWLDKFDEKDREVTIDGTAMDVEDITEFQRRLNLSQYFEDVRWVRSPESRGPGGEVSAYEFTLRARVLYQ